MAVGEKTVSIPDEVVRAVGTAMTIGTLVEWWDTSHPLLLNSTPHRMWERGKKDDVLAFVEAAKSGDMV